MNEIKVSVSIMLQGRILFTQEEAETLEKEQKGSGFDNQVQTIKKLNGKGKENIHYKTRKCIPASQSIKLNKEAYLYMIDKNSCPEWETTKKWSTMSKNERLESHLQKIMEHLKGTSFTYQVFED